MTTMLTSQNTLAAGITAFLLILSAHPGQAQVDNTAELSTTPTHILVRSNTNPNSAFVPVSYRVYAYMNQAGKLHLMINNPERLRYKIDVVDQRNRSVYEEFTNLDRYNRRLDLSALPENSCQVIVSIDNKQYQYKISRETRVAFTLQAQPAVGPQPADESHQDKSERPSIPVTL